MVIKHFKLQRKIKKIKLVIIDVDGVMTDGGVYYDNSGMEYKKFNVKDGFGITTAIYAGIKIAIITGRKSEIVDTRAKELGIDKVYQGARRKYLQFDRIKKDFNVTEDEIAFISDDIIDMGLLKEVGVKVAVKDACKEVKAIADYITPQQGGRGAVRNFLEYLLKKKKLWKKSIQRYY